MRTKVVIHYLGLIIAGLGISMLLPLGWSLYYREPDSLALVISAVVTIVCGLTAWRLSQVSGVKLTKREAIMLTAGTWILASAFGAMPYMLAGTFSNFIDAYFEAMSGFTTTGASVLTSIETMPHGILLWRDLTQWLGGMGIIALFVALFPIFGIGAAYLVEAEMPGPEAERLTTRFRDTARALWILYTGFSGLEVLLLWLAKMPLFDALTVTLGTMPTGGFCIKNLSIGAYNSVFVEIIVILFMVIAGINFSLYYLLLRKRQFRQLTRDPELRLYIILLVGFSLFMGLDLIGNTGMVASEAFRQSSFQAVSIMTTTGFATANFDLWPTFSRAALLLLMIIGASAGSTGGALKVVRILVLVKYAYRRIMLAFNPRAVIPLKLGKNVLSEGIISGIVGMTILYFGSLITGSIAMSAMGLDYITALSSVAATLGNVGPGLHLVGPYANYFDIPTGGKVILTVCMLVGRLEIFTVLALLTPTFWKWR